MTNSDSVPPCYSQWAMRGRCPALMNPYLKPFLNLHVKKKVHLNLQVTLDFQVKVQLNLQLNLFFHMKVQLKVN